MYTSPGASPFSVGANPAAKRILILMSDTGGGHRASAEALRAAFQELYGDAFHVDVVDLWMKHTPWPLNQLPKTYRFLANDAPWLWKLLYEFSENPEATKPIMRAAYRWTRKRVSQLIDQYNPDLVISVHPLLQEVPLRVMARLKKRIPFVTVITDLVSIHPTWFQPNVTLCFVPNDRVYHLALEHGLRPDQLRQCGLPIRPAFAHISDSKDVLRRNLGLRPDVPVALLVGGGEGIGKVAETARAVAARLAAESRKRGQLAGQLVVICGRNRKLRDELAACSWSIPTVVQGFVSNMHEWMAASDCIITKAGPGTIAEALAMGLPIVLNGFIAGQEEGNVPYVVNSGVGVYCEDPQRIAEIICRWFGSERGQLESMARKARQMGYPQATYRIVEEIAKLLESDERAASQTTLPSVSVAAEQLVGQGSRPISKMRYQELLPHELNAILASRPVAYLPLGTLEYHGPHLAIGNDAIKAEAICERACRRTGGVLVPTLYWGIGGGHKDYPASVIVQDQVLSALLDEILSGLHRVGFRVFVLLTGHYPREQVDVVKAAAQRLHNAHADVRIWALPEYEAHPQERRADHAAQWETSILMAIRPDLVDMARLVGADSPDAPDATRTIEEMNSPGPLHGILGKNPARYARPELGEQTIATIVDNLVAWVEKALAEIGPKR